MSVSFDCPRNHPLCLAGITASWQGTAVERVDNQRVSHMAWFIFCKKPSISAYWERNATSTPAFGKIMPRQRFESILHFLHFVDNDGSVIGNPPSPPPWGNMGQGWGFVGALTLSLARGGWGIDTF